MSSDTSIAKGAELLAVLVAAIKSGDRERKKQIVNEFTGKYDVDLGFACDLERNHNDECK